MIDPVFVKSTTLGDTWFHLLWEIYNHGRKYLITNGSFAGAHRLEFDFVSGISMFPHQRPLSPIMPEGISSNPTTTDEKIGEYFANYLMDPVLGKLEEYKYATWINGRFYNPYYSKKPSVPPESFTGGDTQLEWMIRHFKQKGLGNNHCYINIGDRDSNFVYDKPYTNETERGTSPCLRGLDFKVKDGKLLTLVVYRSWDLYGGWPQNMGGFTLLNEYVAEEIGVEPGPMAFSCMGLHCYDFQIEPLENLLKKGKHAE